MDLELDHFFILVEPGAQVADLLVLLGIEESFSRDHEGQGTSNRRFEFSNGMLEFLWVRDANEAINGPGKNLCFSERVENSQASPFGVILHRKDSTSLDMPFEGWKYQPVYFDSSMSFHVGANSYNLLEPLCFYVPFFEPQKRKIEKGLFKSISHVHIYLPVETVSEVLKVASDADGLSISYAEQHLMEVTFDSHQNGLSKDFRPEIPLIIFW